MHHVRGSLSTNTGVAPARMTAAGQEIIVNAGMITSSPDSRRRAVTAASRANDPLQTATPNRRPARRAGGRAKGPGCRGYERGQSYTNGDLLRLSRNSGGISPGGNRSKKKNSSHCTGTRPDRLDCPSDRCTAHTANDSTRESSGQNL